MSASAQREIDGRSARRSALGLCARARRSTVGVTLGNEKLDLDITIFDKIEL